MKNSTTTTSTTPTLIEKLEALTPRLMKKANLLSHQGLEFTPEDLFQEMCVSLFQQVAENPTILDQTDAYIVQSLVWDAQNIAQKGRTYTKYVGPEPTTEDEDGDEVSLFEFIPSLHNEPERTYIEIERAASLTAAILSLSPANQKIVKLMFVGFSQVEIAEKLKISKAAISQRKNTIRKLLVTNLFTKYAGQTPEELDTDDLLDISEIVERISLDTDLPCDFIERVIFSAAGFGA